MNILAAVVTEKGKPLTIETLIPDEPREDEVLVKIVAAGICIITGLLPQGSEVEVDSFDLMESRTMMGSGGLIKAVLTM